MTKIVQWLKADTKKRRRFFKEAEKEIADINLRTLHTFSLMTVLLLVLYILLTPFIIRAWKPTSYHIIFLFCSILFAFAIHFLKKKISQYNTLVLLLCLFFEIMVYGFVILIDTVGVPKGPGVFIPTLCVALSASFVFPYWLCFGSLIFFDTVYICFVLHVKDISIGQYDVFAALVALGFTIVVTCRILALRIRDHETRMKYLVLSTRDPLAQIYNKQACFDAIQKYLRLYNPSVNCALLVLDLDDFKQVNDIYGHYTGDEVLRSTGEGLRNIFRSSDIIGRFGGDEFVILIAGLSNRTVLEEKCRLIQDMLRHVLDEKKSALITCSIGGAYADGQKVDFEALFRQADTALYQAKDAGKSQYVLQQYRV